MSSTAGSTTVNITDGVPFPSTVLVGADEFLLFRVDADHRVPAGHVLHRPVVEVPELGVPVDVLTTLGGLHVRLHAVTPLTQQSADHEITDLVTLLTQCSGQGADRLGRPP